MICPLKGWHQELVAWQQPWPNATMSGQFTQSDPSRHGPKREPCSALLQQFEGNGLPAPSREYIYTYIYDFSEVTLLTLFYSYVCRTNWLFLDLIVHLRGKWDTGKVKKNLNCNQPLSQHRTLIFQRQSCHARFV